MGKINTKEFIIKAKQIHGDKYDYTKTEYINSRTKVCIICPDHGEFWQRAERHTAYKRGCPKCGIIKKSESRKDTLEEFIIKARQVHGWKYDYSKVVYKKSSKKICIICPEHGEFWQTPNSHLRGTKCPKCSFKELGRVVNRTTEQFIEKAKQVHGDEYNYSKVEYKGIKEKICIICPEHGEFWQKAGNHLRGDGCKKCMGKKLREHFSLTTEQFIKKARKIHGDKYDYSKVEYVNSKTPICIICPDHGEFWQLPSKHLNKHGCLACKYSHLENDICQLLKKENINYIYEWHNEIIGKKSVDFYLPDYKIAIECQGRQHFIPIQFFGGKEYLNEIIKRDEDKYNELISNNIKIIYYTKEKNIPTFLKEKYYYHNTIGKIRKELMNTINKK